MRKKLTKIMAIFLSIVMCMQLSELSIFAAGAGSDPTSQIHLAVPEALQDGSNYFFINQSGFTIGEKSKEKLYVPVQRTGNLEGEADVTVKIVDLSARVGENYEIKVLDERVEPETVFGGEAMIDLIQNASSQEEIETMDENQFAESVYEAGGAELMDADGQSVGTFHTYPLDENGNRIGENDGEVSADTTVDSTDTNEDMAPDGTDVSLGTEEGNGVLSVGDGNSTYNPSGTGVQALKDARNAYTGTISDRQEMVSSEDLVSQLTGITEPQAETKEEENASSESGQENEVELVSDDYPGREYALHFSDGEEAKYLVVTPKYSDKTDGDSELMAMLKNPSEDTPVHEGYFMTHVTILDEDEPEPVTVSMADSQITAKDGIATITVTREGRVNAIVGVNVASWDGSASAGDDYSGINANLYFPMGITERSIELPVGQGAEEKDFSVTLTPVTECQIGQATARIVIPASENSEEAALMDDSNKYGDPWNLRDRKSHISNCASFQGDYGVQTRTQDDCLQTQYISLYTDKDYAWDGVHVDYNIFTWYSKAQFKVDQWINYSFKLFNDWINGSGWSNIHTKDWGDLSEAWQSDTADVYFGSEKSPLAICILQWCYEIHNRFRDSYSAMNINNVQPIKRKFNIVVDNPESLDFIGMKALPEGVVNPYERFLVNNTLNRNFSLLTGDSFSVSPIQNANEDEMPRFTRLAGIDAVKDGKTMRIITLNGESETPNVKLDPPTINKLAENGFISWNKGSDGSYSGTIHFRPVFEYKDVTIEVKDSQYGSFKTANLSPGTHTKTFHMGDELTMETKMSATGTLAGLSPSGFAWTAQTAKNGTYLRDSTMNYINGKSTFVLDKPYYILEPTFTETKNQVVVKVNENDLSFFDETKGIFSADNKWKDGSTWNYLIEKDVLANRIVEMQAVPKDPQHAPVWTTTQDNLKYSGQAFYIRTGAKASDNAVTLTVSRSANSNAWYSLSGTVYSTTRNLSSGYDVKANENTDAESIVNKATGALVAAGTVGTYTDENGAFTLAPQYLSGGTTLRYIVTYNGTVNIREVHLPSAGVQKQSVTYNDPENPGSTLTVNAVSLSANLVDVDSFSAENTHFGSVYAVQEGKVSGVVSAVSMNGQKIVFTVTVEPGQPYLCGDETLTENIEEVRLFFKSTLNGETHGSWSSKEESVDNNGNDSGESEEESEFHWNPETGTATLTFDRFTPDEESIYDVGDVLYAQLTTDRKVDGNSFFADDGAAMIYDPVSTGITVVADLDYEPETANYDMPLDAESIMGSLQDDDERASYGQFPFIGEITFAVKLLSPIKKYMMDNTQINMIMDDLYEDDDANSHLSDQSFDIDDHVNEWEQNVSGKDIDPSEYNNKGYTRSKWNFNIALKVRETPYGGTRFMMAVIANLGGGGKAYESKKDPYEAKGIFEASLKAPLDYHTAEEAKKDNWSKSDIQRYRSQQGIKEAHLGGGYFQFTFYLGVYFDFGYIEITKTDGSTEKSHDFVFMGGGGFFGANASVGVTAYAWVVVVPAYINFEGNANLTVFAGWGADPNKTLELYKTEKHHDYGDGWGVNLDVQLTGSAALTFGVGLYKILGIRASGGMSAELDYSLKMADWYPNTDFGMGDSWGYGTNITFSGTIDLLFMSIPLWEYSWDGPLGGGFVKYFRQVRLGNVLIQLVNKSIEEGDGSAEARAECRRRVTELQQHIDALDLATDDLEEMVDDLRDYAYENDVIDYFEMDLSRMSSAAGIAGSIQNAIMMADEEDPSVPMSGNTDAAYFVRDHVDSEWVAGSGELMSGYDPVGSTTLMKNAYAQPSSQIMSIGNNNLLMVFLDDRGSGSKTQSAILKYTIYNSEKDEWSEPEAVQNDHTGDSKPSLVDAGNKLILSWASTADEKYQALRNAVTEELKTANDSDPTENDIEAALETDAARVMAQMDIFTVEFDKNSQSFGEIVQLTDDSYYDDYPQAVYDSETGDYIVLYTKTAQDTEKYSNTEERTAEEQTLLDMVNPYAADRTYSVLCYMLYNNQEDAKDTNDTTHEAGWAKDYLFVNETALDHAGQQAFLEAWKGQRFLSSPVTGKKDGKVIQLDPPISDLNVCEGYHGLAAYAFTADLDQDLDTSEDKALFLQFYDFEKHKTYVPIRVAGDAEKTQLVTPKDKTQSGYSYVTTEEQVTVGMPKMVRNGGSTWLFWREGSSSLRYLDVSAMLKAKVETGKGNDEWERAVREDGTFAIDSRTGKAWKPDVQTVDFGSAVSGDVLNITDYQVFTDAEDNLYVIYSDTTSYDMDDSETGQLQGTALEIYATAKVKDETSARIMESEDIGSTVAPASWSKPNRLTKANNYNDGLAVAQDDNGDLIIVHNEYTIESKRGDLDYLKSHGLITTDENGKEKLTGDPTVRSPISLKVTRCKQAGSIEVCDFDVSDHTPKGGDKVMVTARMVNNGLIAADGYTVDFYECKGDQKIREIETLDSDEIIPVNTGEKVWFEWTVPSEGVEGYCIRAVVKEKKKLTGYYEVETYDSPTFHQIPRYTVEFDSVKQNGDAFDVNYTVTNTGNASIEDGTEARLRLAALHGDLKEVYGMDDDLLLKTDLSGLDPGNSKKISESVTIPVSVFKYCGFDAVKVQILSKDMEVLEDTGAWTITMDQPMNLKLNDSQAMLLSTDETREAKLSYDTTVFLDTPEVVYSVEDNSVANVDQDGHVTGLGSGATTLTATLMPSGRRTSVKVTVQGSDGSSGGSTVSPGYMITVPAGISYGSASASAKQAKAGEQVTITVNPEEGAQTVGVNVTDEEGNVIEVTDNGDGTYTFTMPDSRVTVTPVFTKEGETTCPRDDSCPMTPFTDADKMDWYHDGVHWAIEKGIMNGTGENIFEPLTSTSRAMIVTMLWRMEGSPQVDESMTFSDVPDGQWYTDAVRWAAANSIVNGYSEEEFGPADNVTREQIVTILYRYAQFKGVDVSRGETAYLNDYTDARDIAEWAVKAFRWAVDADVIQGMTDTTLSPKSDAVRAQVATMLMRFENLI